MSATNINRVVLTGNLTRDPELRSTASGTSVCSLRLACNTRRKNSAGEWEDKPNYFDVTVWGAQGENCARFLAKGRPVAIDGRLEWREWDARRHGKRQADRDHRRRRPVPRRRTRRRRRADGDAGRPEPAGVGAAPTTTTTSRSSGSCTGPAHDRPGPRQEHARSPHDHPPRHRATRPASAATRARSCARSWRALGHTARLPAASSSSASATASCMRRRFHPVEFPDQAVSAILRAGRERDVYLGAAPRARTAAAAATRSPYSPRSGSTPTPRTRSRACRRSRPRRRSSSPPAAASTPTGCSNTRSTSTPASTRTGGSHSTSPPTNAASTRRGSCARRTPPTTDTSRPARSSCCTSQPERAPRARRHRQPLPPAAGTQRRAPAPRAAGRRGGRAPRAAIRCSSSSPPSTSRALLGVPIGRDRKVSCPFHGDEHPSLHVYPTAAQGWHCFSCGRGGSVYDLAAALWDVQPRGVWFLKLRAELRAVPARRVIRLSSIGPVGIANCRRSKRRGSPLRGNGSFPPEGGTACRTCSLPQGHRFAAAFGRPLTGCRLSRCARPSTPAFTFRGEAIAHTAGAPPGHTEPRGHRAEHPAPIRPRSPTSSLRTSTACCVLSGPRCEPAPRSSRTPALWLGRRWSADRTSSSTRAALSGCSPSPTGKPGGCRRPRARSPLEGPAANGARACPSLRTRVRAISTIAS